MTTAMMLIGLAAAAPATVRSGIDAWQQGDPARAVTIWRGLAGRGDPDAAFNLGQAYRLGRGVPADSSEAKGWFEKAARAGHLDAQVSLGLLLFDIGDRAAALVWLKRAADRGEPRALLVTGTALFNGDGLKRDQVLGYAYVSRAAAQGLAPAQATLADMDKVMPVEARRKGVALALAAASKPASSQPKPATPKPVTPKPAIRQEANAAASPAPAPVELQGSGRWRIQLGAFGTKGAAQALFSRLGPSLGGARAYYIAAGAVTRLQAGPYATRADAARACARLRPQPCFAVAGN